MTSIVSRPTQEWRREQDGVSYLISTSRDHLSLPFINDAFGTEEMHWAKSLPLEDLEMALANSLTLGVYVLSPKTPPASSASSPSSPRTPSPTLDANEEVKQIGMARFATDFVTFAYLSDVFIVPEQRQRGLSTWLIGCCNEVIASMPHLRRALLFTGHDKEQFYTDKLGLRNFSSTESEHLVCMTKRTYARRH